MKEYSKNYNKFIIFATPRSGTHMLRSSLLMHSNIVVHGEVFNHSASAFFPYGVTDHPEDILDDHVFHPYSNSVHAVGFPIHDFQYFAKPNKHWLNVWGVLSEIEDLFVIRLQRRNIAEQFISNVMAQLTGKWWLYHQKSSKDRQKRIFCKPHKMMDYFISLEKVQSKIEPMLSGHRQMTVYYEDICTNFSNEIVRIQEFIEVDPMDVRPMTSKQDHRKIWDRVENYEELKEFFSNTKYAAFFN
ncbi:MAG: hypothetical protein ABW168_27200 [Sedimenticola sp.]